MWACFQPLSKWTVTLAVLFLAASWISLPLVKATTGEGSLQLSVQGYGTVHGQLQNATVQPDNSIAMAMVVNDHMQTPQGVFPVTASGRWIGFRNDSAVAGSILDVTGKVQICILFLCNDANFIGGGLWSGILNNSTATGAFNGTITFTNSPVTQIPKNTPIPVSGTWNADFQVPIPEFNFGEQTYLLIFVASVLLIALVGKTSKIGRQDRRKQESRSQASQYLVKVSGACGV